MRGLELELYPANDACNFLLAWCTAHEPNRHVHAVPAQDLLLDQNADECVCICLDLSFGAKHGPGEDHQVYVRFYTLIPCDQALQSQEAVLRVPGISAAYK